MLYVGLRWQAIEFNEICVFSQMFQFRKKKVSLSIFPFIYKDCGEYMYTEWLLQQANTLSFLIRPQQTQIVKSGGLLNKHLEL